MEIYFYFISFEVHSIIERNSLVELLGFSNGDTMMHLTI
jgi:hypothetical protein